MIESGNPDHHYDTTRASANRENHDQLLPVCTTLVLLLGVLIGIGAGVPAVLADTPVPGGLLVGGGALAAAVKFFDWLIK
jgi:hypothetical protein